MAGPTAATFVSDQAASFRHMPKARIPFRQGRDGVCARHNQPVKPPVRQGPERRVKLPALRAGHDFDRRIVQDLCALHLQQPGQAKRLARGSRIDDAKSIKRLRAHLSRNILRPFAVGGLRLRLPVRLRQLGRLIDDLLRALVQDQLCQAASQQFGVAGSSGQLRIDLACAVQCADASPQQQILSRLSCGRAPGPGPLTERGNRRATASAEPGQECAFSRNRPPS